MKTRPSGSSRRLQARGIAACAVAMLQACGTLAGSTPQPTIGVRSKDVVTQDGLRFRDANGNGRLDACEDWRVLDEQFKLGLFENPYVDAAQATGIIGSDAHRAKGLEVQKQSVVLLQNPPQATGKTLPLAAGARVYTMGMGRADVKAYGYVVTDSNYTAPALRPSAAGDDYAIIRVQVTNVNTAGYRTQGPTSGADPSKLNPTTGLTWGAEDPCHMNPSLNPVCVDDSRSPAGVPRGPVFGGALPSETNNLSFTTMAVSQSWRDLPPRPDIQAVIDNEPDVPGYPAADALYPYGFGLSY